MTPTRENLWKGMKPFRKINAAEKKLVKALRSGRYKQAKSQLRDGQKFCCLGVACDVSGRGKWNGDKYAFRIGLGSAAESYSLPGPVAAALGWRGHYGFFRQDKVKFGPLSLAGLNDSGYTFLEIARVIELGAVKKA